MELDLLSLSSSAGRILELLDAVALPLIAAFVPIFIIEVIALWKSSELNKQRVSGLLTSAFCVLPATAVELLAGGALVAAFYMAASWAPWSVPLNWASALLCLVLVDFTYYWEHRLAHRVNLLWCGYHAVHHSADHYDQSIALRVSFVDFFITPWFYLPLVLTGFHPLLVLLCFALVIAYQTWIHTELVGRLRYADGWLNTPSNHRVHHGRNPQYLDKNYGGVLILWDRLFGSYAAEDEPVDYGLTEPQLSRNPLRVHFGSLLALWRALRASGGATTRLRLLFGPPAASRS